MPKYIINCKDPNKLTTNDKCDLCKNIDNMYKDIESQTDQDLKQKMINTLEGSLVDGYRLLNVYEKGGIGPIYIVKVNELRNYYNITDSFLSKLDNYFNDAEISNDKDVDSPVILHSRWCKRCGTRKKDIYDCEKIISKNELSFVNFAFSIDEIRQKVHIYWEDPTSICISTIRLYRRYMNPNVGPNEEDCDLCVEYNRSDMNKHKYPNGYEDNAVFFSYENKNTWYYKICCFDKFENLVATSEIKSITI